MLTPKKHLVAVSAFVALMSMLVFFQNCAGGFEPSLKDGALAASGTGGTTAEPTPSPGDVLTTPTPIATATPLGATPTPSPATPTPVVAIKRSFVYMGGSGRIPIYEINHETDTVTARTAAAIDGQTPGWFAYDSRSQRLLTADSGGARLNTFVVGSDGHLTLEKAFNFLSSVVHLTAYKSGDLLTVLAANYDGSQFGKYDLSGDLMSIQEKKVFSYANGSHSHSTSYDSKRGLIFVANKDEGRIHIYRDVVGGAPVELKSFVLPDVRIVLYDAVFDRVYVTTEAYSGSSYVKIYDVSATDTSADLIEVDSHAMGLRGADLKVDHSHNYVGASVREAGKEGIWILPVTAAGRFDTIRTKIFLPITGSAEARSLQITGNGRYYILTCNNQANDADLFIFKIEYDASGAITTKALLQQINAGASEFPSNFVLDRTD
jgi:6-phosphogluconolactonase (cycloisomerase 2 family)